MPPSTQFFCNYCEVVGATATTTRESASLPALIPATPPTPYVVFTAFSITSDYKTNGTCTTSSRLVTLSSSHTVRGPTTIPASDFYRTANAFLIDWLGFSTCSGGGDVRKAAYSIPIPNSLQANLPALTTLSSTSYIKSYMIDTAQATVSPSRTSSASLNRTQFTSPSRTPSASRHWGKPATIGVAVAMSVLALILLAVFLKFWRRYRKSKSAESSKAKQNGASPEANHQPFLQQKAELEAENNVTHELEAKERRHELFEGKGNPEITGKSCRGLPLHQSRQELRGEEHAKELANERERKRDLSTFGWS